MDKEKLIQAMLNETDGQKAKAIADVIAAETEKESKLAELSSRERISENECEAKKNEVEAKKLEAEARERPHQPLRPRRQGHGLRH